MKTYVGIDVSKDTLMMSFSLTTDIWRVNTFANSPDGIESLISKLPPDAHVIIEATGSYSVLLTYLLGQAKICLSVISPTQSHHFAKMRLSVTKTDKSDAALLAKYGQIVQPPLYEMDSYALLRLRQKRALLRQLKKQQRSLANLLHSFSPLPIKDDQVQIGLQQMLACVQAAINTLITEIQQLTEEHFPIQIRRLTSITGISITIATALIDVTGGFRQFHSAKALAKYIGVVPIVYQSGKANFKRGICKTGDPHLRAMLYMASWSAVRHNKPCREFYQRLKAAGKSTKVALIAVINKLLRQAFAVVKFDQEFDPNYFPVLRTYT